MPIEQIGLITMALAAISHVTIVLTSDVVIRFFAFLIFEACVGLYFPMIGTLKGNIVPEDMRSTIYNIYRFPLNIAVLLPLLLNFSITTTFVVTTTILLFAGFSSFSLMQMRADDSKSASQADPQEMEAIVMGNPDQDEGADEQEMEA